jgi:hypothetical protein
MPIGGLQRNSARPAPAIAAPRCALPARWRLACTASRRTTAAMRPTCRRPATRFCKVVNPADGSSNVALASAGAVSSASSTLSGYPLVTVNDNERAGVGWSQGGGGWADATPERLSGLGADRLQRQQDDQPGGGVHAAGQLPQSGGADRQYDVRAVRDSGLHGAGFRWRELGDAGERSAGTTW